MGGLLLNETSQVSEDAGIVRWREGRRLKVKRRFLSLHYPTDWSTTAGREGTGCVSLGRMTAKGSEADARGGTLASCGRFRANLTPYWQQTDPTLRPGASSPIRSPTATIVSGSNNFSCWPTLRLRRKKALAMIVRE